MSQLDPGSAGRLAALGTSIVVLDSNGATMKDYMVKGIPTTVIVGRDGTVKKVFVGFGGEESEKQLDEAVAEAIKDPKPAK